MSVCPVQQTHVFVAHVQRIESKSGRHLQEEPEACIRGCSQAGLHVRPSLLLNVLHLRALTLADDTQHNAQLVPQTFGEP